MSTLRVPVVLITSAAFGVALAVASVLSGWQPWALIVMTAELSSYAPFVLVQPGLAPGLVLLVALVIASALALALRLLLRRFGIAAGLALCQAFGWVLVIAGILAYPEVRGFSRFAQIEHCNEAPVVTYVDRNLDYEKPTVRGLVILPPSQSVDQHFPEGWPYSLLDSSNTLYVTAQRSEVAEIVRLLRSARFFEFPEQFNPRPSLDHAARFVALSCNGSVVRTFGRLGDPGGDRIWSLEEAIIPPLGLSSEWWEEIPGDVNLRLR